MPNNKFDPTVVGCMLCEMLEPFDRRVWFKAAAFFKKMKIKVVDARSCQLFFSIATKGII